MKFLLETHLLPWAAADTLPAAAEELVDDEAHELLVSAASIWKVAIKYGLGRSDFGVDPGVLRRGLLDHGYADVPVTSVHAARVAGLPGLHPAPCTGIRSTAC